MDIVNDLVIPLAASPWIYLLLFAFIVGDSVIPMLPSETLVAGLAAMSATTGQPSMTLLVVAAVAGALLGDNLAYGLGRWWGAEKVAALRTRHDALYRVMEWARSELDQRPVSVLLTARYIPLGRTAVTLTAGATRFPWHRFAPISFLAVLGWAAYNALAGFLAGWWLRDHPVLGVGLAIVVAIVLGTLIDRLVRAVQGQG